MKEAKGIEDRLTAIIKRFDELRRDLEGRIGETVVALYEVSWAERCKRLEKEERERLEHEEYLRHEAVKKRYNNEVNRLYALINEAKGLRIRSLYSRLRRCAGESR